jgi:hypothetical protein
MEKWQIRFRYVIASSAISVTCSNIKSCGLAAIPVFNTKETAALDLS